MATGAFDSADSSVGTNGKQITLSWATPGGDGWTSPFVVIADPSGAVSLRVDQGGPNDRTLTAVTQSGAPTVVSTDLRATFNISGFIEKDETVKVTITAGLISDSSVTPDETGATTSTVITNSSTFVGLAPLNELKRFLNIDTSTTTYDTQLTTYLRVATNLLERCLGRDPGKFLSQSITETLDGKGSEKLQLRNWPVTAISSVKRVLSDGSTETVASTDYRYEQNTGELELIGDSDDYYYNWPSGNPFVGRRVFPRPRFAEGFRNVQVTYTGGYTPATMPPALQWAAIEVAAHLYRRQGRDTSMSSESLGDYSYTAADPMKVSEAFRAYCNSVGCVVVA